MVFLRDTEAHIRFDYHSQRGMDPESYLTLDVEGGTLAYSLHGSRGPLLVLACGIGDSRHAFRFVIPELSKAGYRVAAMDIRGCGDSSVNWPAYSRTLIAKDMIALVRHIGVESAVIVGHSISGGAATIAAALDPSLIKALVEIAPATRAMSIGLSDLFRTGVPSLIGSILFGSVRLWLAYLNAALPGTERPPDWQQDLARIESKLLEPGRMTAFKQSCFSPPTDAGEKLKDVKCPTLIIEGSLDCDFADPRREGEAIVGLLGQGLGKLTVIDGSGHYPHRQHPEATTAAILAFLKEVYT